MAHGEFAHKLAELERTIERHDMDIKSIFEAIRRLMAPAPAGSKRMYPQSPELTRLLQTAC